jgi:hypothetical protein
VHSWIVVFIVALIQLQAITGISKSHLIVL